MSYSITRRPFHTPILIIAWRRPSHTQELINCLRKVKPTCIYIACDGPNQSRQGEEEKVAKTRSVLDSINWNCDIHKLYHSGNQGCFYGVTSAINWFFSQIDYGIILEDDCIPHLDFFPFCEELLSAYRFDSRVWAISGNNFQNGKWTGKADYYFSKYFHCWGWATWRRAWEQYDGHIDSFKLLDKSEAFRNLFGSRIEAEYWIKCFNSITSEDIPTTWDHQFFYAMLINNALSIMPNRNLVSNIGFGIDATHCAQADIQYLADRRGLKLAIHPQYIKPDLDADLYTFKNTFTTFVSRRRLYVSSFLRDLSFSH